MTPFGRSFPVGNLADWDSKNVGNAVRALFDRWCLPGEKAAGTSRLRIAVRDRYLSFYLKGQSVAELRWGPRGPKLSVHRAYASGKRRDATPPTKGHEHYGADELADPATASLIADWIETAATYAKAEKCFVDDLVAANPGSIDVEIALPGTVRPDGRPAAPRMDLMVAQRPNGEPLSICFWEAKCAINPELRRRSGPPQVIAQIDTYVSWTLGGNRVAEVQKAYRMAADTLLDLYHLFRATDDGDHECVRIWQALAGSESPLVVARPGIVIGNYWPEGYSDQIASGRMAQHAASFARNGHRDKLQQAGAQVHEVGPDHGLLVLPFIPAIS